MAISTAAAGFGVAVVAESSRSAVEAAHAWTCAAARQTVELAAVAHLAATGGLPASIHDLTDGDRPQLVLPGEALLSDDGLELTIDRWTVVLQPADGTVSARCDDAG